VFGARYAPNKEALRGGVAAFAGIQTRNRAAVEAALGKLCDRIAKAGGLGSGSRPGPGAVVGWA